MALRSRSSNMVAQAFVVREVVTRVYARAHLIGWVATNVRRSPGILSRYWYLLGTEPFLVAVRDRIESHIQVRLRGPIRADRIRSSFLYKLYTSDKESIRRLDAQINSSGLVLPRKHL